MKVLNMQSLHNLLMHDLSNTFYVCTCVCLTVAYCYERYSHTVKDLMDRICLVGLFTCMTKLLVGIVE